MVQHSIPVLWWGSHRDLSEDTQEPGAQVGLGHPIQDPCHLILGRQAGGARSPWDWVSGLLCWGSQDDTLQTELLIPQFFSQSPGGWRPWTAFL